MEWNKYFVDSRAFAAVNVFAIILLLISFYQQEWLLSFISILIIVLYVINNLYLKYIGEQLLFKNEKEKQKCFIDDTVDMQLMFINKGLPILNGHIIIYVDKVVEPITNHNHHSFNRIEIKIPFSVPYKGTYKVKVPMIAKRRGVAKIRKMEIHIPHFFGFGETVLEYKTMVKKEVLVYPKSLQVKGLETLISKEQGEQFVPFSLYEDMLSPVGARDYVAGDRFQTIHWKASARMNKLQTKVYTNVSSRTWMVALNITNQEIFTNEKLEQLISHVANLAFFAMKNDVAYSLYVNVRSKGKQPFLYLPLGQGKEQLQRALELLAIVELQAPLYPYDKMLYFIERHHRLEPVTIHGGHLTDLDEKRLGVFISKDFHVKNIKMINDEAILDDFFSSSKRRRVQ